MAGRGCGRGKSSRLPESGTSPGLAISPSPVLNKPTHQSPNSCNSAMLIYAAALARGINGSDCGIPMEDQEGHLFMAAPLNNPFTMKCVDGSGKPHKKGQGQLIQATRSIPVGTTSRDDPFKLQIKAINLAMEDYDYEDPGTHPVRVCTLLPLVQKFHVPSTDDITPESFILRPTVENQHALITLQSKLNIWYNQYEVYNPGPSVHLSNIVIGGHYVAHIEEKNGWCRVVIRSLEWEIRKIRVQLLDDGDTHLVDLEDLRPIRKVFCQLPMQAYHAKIQGILPAAADKLTPEEMKEFRNDVGGKDWMVYIVDDAANSQHAPFHTLHVVLFRVGRNNDTEVYDFGKRIHLGYRFEPDA